MYIGVCIFILVETGCLLTDLFSLSDMVDANMYDDIQVFLRIIIGLTATISLMAVLGRLNTNFLNIPQWMMFSLYLYAGIQMLYPITYNPYYTSKDIASLQYNINKDNSTVVSGKTRSREPAEIRHYGDYRGCRRTLGGVYHEQKLHQVVTVGEGALHQIYLAAAYRLFEAYFKFSVGEMFDFHFAEFYAEFFADFLRHIARFSTGENLERMKDGIHWKKYLKNGFFWFIFS